MVATITTDSDKKFWEYTEDECLNEMHDEISGIHIPISFLEQERIDVIAMGIESCLKDLKLDIKVKGSVVTYGSSPRMYLEFLKKKGN